jgi:hypothetical protein
MALDMGNKSVGITSAASLTVVPNGPSVVILSNSGTHPVYVGVGSNTTTADGFYLVNGSPAVTFPTFVSSMGETLWAIASGGTSSVSWAVSTTH